MSKIELVQPGKGSEAQNAFLASVPPINLFKALANQPVIAAQVATLGGAILYRTELDPKLRELAILRAAHLAGCWYEIVHHERIGRDVGLSDAELAAVRTSDGAAALGADAVLVCLWSQEVQASGRPSGATLAACLDRFGPVQTLELASTVAYYLMVASLLQTFEIPVEEAGFTDGVKINQRPADV